MNTEIIIKNLVDLQDYQTTWQAMRNFTMQRMPNTPDEIWFLEHPPVFTQGQAGKAEHVLFPGDIPVVQTDRGGQVTYHGPGQLMAYALIDIRRRKIGVKEFVNLLENSVVDMLSVYNIIANIKPDAPGVYVNGAKICSIGLKITRGSSYHGIALNVVNDLEPFNRINPCGFTNLQMTKINDFVPDIKLTQVQEQLQITLLTNLINATKI